ncbi:ubiquitin-conjugating enzyme/RWD-like protein [Annulohypoxylon maeteangense]|uniref:ubiquitin-conjugating enzyme/RWD-like protein n=1 Tax=Annulohypoxylon maeteangense TaxID=1927788 RepID=UPI0020088CEC|nr:ubiquitin-conjugating enzyme/RWD-like protein [Annulohypoxylon maeteangense]KAI0879889.1 ubiquitin-conjugating enzyme/RWD-like protein [Annulohypoxylon maeteangense]
MASSRARRVAKELADIEADARNSGITAQPANNNGDLTHLKACLPGPPSTPYEGGQFIVDVRIPNEYPFRPPVMKFDTKVWHPNISSQTGAICLDTLSSAWSPVLTIKSTLLSLQGLFESPEPKDPQDAEVARMMINDREAFNKKAHEWAVLHAGAPRNPNFQSVQPRTQVAPQQVDDSRYQGYNKDLINRFVNMGFDIDRVVEAFQFVGIDRLDGQDYELEEAYMGDITARLLGEP